MKDNVLKEKSYRFAVRIVKLYQYLCNEKKEFVLSKQLLRSGTSIGANIEEAIGAKSKKDFLYKLTISYKEAREVEYWIRLLRDTEYLLPRHSKVLLEDINEIMRLIGSIQTTMKKKYNL